MLRRQKHALSESTTPFACTLRKVAQRNRYCVTKILPNVRVNFLVRFASKPLFLLANDAITPWNCSKIWPGPSAEMCRGFLFYKFWRILPGIYLNDIFLGTFSNKNEEKKSGDKIRERSRRPKKKTPRKIRSAKNRPKKSLVLFVQFFACESPSGTPSDTPTVSGTLLGTLRGHFGLKGPERLL